MAKTLIGTSSLIFGTTDETWGLLENLEYTESVESVEVTDADGDITDVAFHGKKTEVSGTYVWKQKSNSPEARVGSSSPINITNSGDGDAPTGDIYITEVKLSYKKGAFKAVDFVGMIYPDLS